jgi:hypothetical protein
LRGKDVAWKATAKGLKADSKCNARTRPLGADTVAKIFGATGRAILIRRQDLRCNEDSKCWPRDIEHCAIDPRGGLLQHYLP